jgi:hypothetical protein
MKNKILLPLGVRIEVRIFFIIYPASHHTLSADFYLSKRDL